MKLLLSIAIFAAGIAIGLALSKPLLGRTPNTTVRAGAVDTPPGKWQWPDSLDAVRAAPNSHHVIFENADVRILEVVIGPYENEPMHTHSLPSVMFGNRLSAHGAFNIVYYRYGYDSTGKRYVVRDSSGQHAPAARPDAVDPGYLMKPEQPHSIKNLSNVTIDAYRVEFKNHYPCACPSSS